MPDKDRIIRLGLLIFAAIGLLAVLGFGIWGAIKLAAGFPSPKTALTRLASLVSGVTLTRERIAPIATVTVDPKAVTTGNTFTIAWERGGNDENIGAYELTYPCDTSATLQLPSGETIQCNALFNLWSKNSMTLAIISKSLSPVNLPISIYFTAQGKSEPVLVGTGNITVTPKQEILPNANVPPAPKPEPAILTPGTETTNTYFIGSQTKIGSGAADLTIQIVDVGIINEATGIFTHATSVNPNQRAGIVFDVTNIGGVPSQQWKFQAALPAAGGNFTSDTQDSIAAGARIRYTIGFRDLNHRGENTAVITIDPHQQISDVNRANNTASTTIVRDY
ncbi:MAG: hypothetical protein HYT40_02385 [Candidatus Sungbacteria bacterium]|uniref:CARDB domain-containing protein n=1 Tax=Candidatus Sungiibacteriota bacterium TaxID=2750080 RepID=A0A931SDI1_9BACT|nr:hypothetical protein [Candidatus Sungbacteria bacterium]